MSDEVLQNLIGNLNDAARRASVAEETHAEMLSVGVELRSWVTSGRAPSFAAIVRDRQAATTDPDRHQPEYAYYPTQWVEPYLDRRRRRVEPHLVDDEVADGSDE